MDTNKVFFGIPILKNIKWKEKTNAKWTVNTSKMKKTTDELNLSLPEGPPRTTKQWSSDHAETENM